MIIVEDHKEEITVIQLSDRTEKFMEMLQSSELTYKISYGDKESCELFRKYNDYVFIRKGCHNKKVAVREITFLEAQRNYCNIYLNDKSTLNVSMPMNEVYEYLNPAHFKRVHRSFIINLEFVETLKGNMLQLQNGKEIVIGREYRDRIDQEFVCIGSRKRTRLKNE